MQRLSDTLVLSATDISDHLSCPHLLQQRIAVARGERARPPKEESPHADLVRERGDAHEREQLELMAAEHGGVVDLTAEDWPRSAPDLEREAGRAEAAMRDGAPLIFQATLFAGLAGPARHRLDSAVSGAWRLAVLVYSPDLLDADA